MEKAGADQPAPEPLPGTYPSESFKREYFQSSTPAEPKAESTGIETEREFPLLGTESSRNKDSSGRNFFDQSSSVETGHVEDSNVFGRSSHPHATAIASKHAKVVEDDQPQAQKPTSAVVNLGDDISHQELSSSEVSVAGDEQHTSDDAELRKGHEEAVDFEPIRTHQSRPKLAKQGSKAKTEEEIFRTLSRKWTKTSGHQNSYAASVEGEEEQEEIQRLMSRMFGKDRKAQSEDEQTRHVGVVWKHLTVKGIGLGAALQPTIGDPFMAPFRLLAGLFTNPRRVAGKPPIRTLLNDFTGCVRPGEMLLVLGRPGAGCSTFLKMFGNQRFGYKEIKGDVTYGGTSAEKMGKDFRGEVLYNPEDDLHYATLSVKNTLQFALKTKTPGKASRNDGETRSQYVKEFLRVVTKLFWIEHTLGTKVGNEYVRGVSGGEKKRVSIAEAMITRASSQAWDNSTRGLDASTALEYVQAIRTLTNMAQVSTAVALYQAGESLYDLFDKVSSFWNLWKFKVILL